MKMNFTKKFVALLFVLAVSYTVNAQECVVSVTSQLRSTWNDDNGGVFSLFDGSIRNSGADLAGVTLSTSSDFSNMWELEGEAGTYKIPRGIAANGVHQFGYVVSGTEPADWAVSSCLFEDGSVGTPVDKSVPLSDAPVDEAEHIPAKEFTKIDETDEVEEDLEEEVAAGAKELRGRGYGKGKGKGKGKSTKAPVSTKAPTKAPVTTKAPTKAPVTTKAASSTTKSPSSGTTKSPSSGTTKSPSSGTTKSPVTTKAASTTTTTTTKSPVTSAPSTPVNGQVCPAGSWWRPSPTTTWQWQISGTVDTSINVQMYDIDMFSATTALVKKLHDAGRVVICYFSTQYEDWRPDAKDFPSSVLGKDLDDWAGEKWVDYRSTTVRAIMQKRLDLAKSKGCDGVEPDNVDSYSTSTGFSLTKNDQLDYNKFIASEAHKRGLSVGLKNDLEQVKDLEPYFDWALNEQCNEYKECAMLNPFITKGKAVFITEYTGSASSVCPQHNTAKYSTLFKDLSLNAKINAQCCTYASGGCKSAPYTCVSSSSKRELGEEEEPVRQKTRRSIRGKDLKNSANEQPVVETKTSSAVSLTISVFTLAAVVFVLFA